MTETDAITIKKIFFFAGLLFSISPWCTTPLALFSGILVANINNANLSFVKSSYTQKLLQTAVVGLGFGINVNEALTIGREGFWLTLFTIVFVMILGLLLGKWFKLEKKLTFLISSGTAICGGSAIAAVAPVVKANDNQISVSLGVVFMLNAIALLIFPFIGKFVGLTEHQFGLWSAIAIHDTSSVVGAAARYGEQALQVATTVKLSRTLWIIPLVLLTTLLFKQHQTKIKIPYFILFFLMAMLLSTHVQQLAPWIPYITKGARAILTMTLFLIGSTMSKSNIRSVGLKSFLLAFTLWILIASTSLLIITSY